MASGLLEFTELEKKFCYVTQTTRMFLLDTDNKQTHVELNCLKLHQPGCSGYIKSLPDNLDPGITVFPIHDIPTM